LSEGRALLFHQLLITKLPKMTPLKISLPVDRRNNWGHLEVTGNIEVSTDNFDTLSQAYKDLKPQIADLLFIAGAENKIVADIQKIQAERREKNAELRICSNKITRANKQLERLTTFLAALGINASDIHLCISDSALAQLSSIQPVVLSDDDIDDDG
jgi:hypothetical protein